MRGFDAFAGAIKSGGKTRRAAKMVILNVDHPDVVDFIDCKAIEEKKAWALIDAGYDGGFNVVGGAYDSVNYQNANHSVRVTDEFMHAVLARRRLVDPRRRSTAARSRRSRRATSCARWPTPRGSAAIPASSTTRRSTTGTRASTRSRINASNPCSEYMFLDDSACNLASLNLRKFQTASRRLRRRGLPRACEITTRRWRSSSTTRAYPTEKIGENCYDSVRSVSATPTSARC